MIKINEKIFIEGLILFLKTGNKKAAVISDTHVGFIRSLNKRGILIEDNQIEILIGDLSRSLDISLDKSSSIPIKKKLDYFIIDGDFFHEFSKIDYSVIENAKKLIGFILTVSKDLIIIKGNHDKIIKELFPSISSGKRVHLEECFELDEFLMTHGDKLIRPTGKKIKTVIIGHEHPALRLYSKTRYEEYKAFLIRNDLIVLPSYNKIIEGHDILREKSISPYISRMTPDEFEKFDVYVYAAGKNAADNGEKNIYFHKISDIKKTQRLSD